MGRKNYLIEGLSGTGKTTVAEELQRRGHQVIHGDRELAYQGDPETGEPTDTQIHEHHIWNIKKVTALASGHSAPATFFCGGSRNFPQFLRLFDRVFVLEVDLVTLTQRLKSRPTDEWAGGKPVDRVRIEQWHRNHEQVPVGGVRIDATAPLADVVDDILRRCGLGI